MTVKPVPLRVASESPDQRSSLIRVMITWILARLTLPAIITLSKCG